MNMGNSVVGLEVAVMCSLIVVLNGCNITVPPIVVNPTNDPPVVITTTTTTTTTTMPPVSNLGSIVTPPSNVLGGETVSPFGKDIRFLMNDRIADGSKLSNGQFCGTWGAPQLQRAGNVYTFPEHSEGGILYHVEGWAYPGSKDAIHPGNSVTWNDDGTLRVYITARK